MKGYLTLPRFSDPELGQCVLRVCGVFVFVWVHVGVVLECRFSGLSADVQFFSIGPSIYTRGGCGVDLPLSLLHTLANRHQI